MPRLIFRDFDEFADSIEGIAGRFVPTARSTAEWWVDAVPAGAAAAHRAENDIAAIRAQPLPLVDAGQQLDHGQRRGAVPPVNDLRGVDGTVVAHQRGNIAVELRLS